MIPNHCALCGAECGARFGCGTCYPQVQLRAVPTGEEWVRGPRKPFPDRASLTDRLITRAALAFYRAFVAVNEWRKERK